VSHGLYLVDEKTLDYDDLGDDSKDLRGTLSYVGMELDEYEKLPPVPPGGNPGLLLRIRREPVRGSTRRCAAAAADEIEFWAGKESPRSSTLRSRNEVRGAAGELRHSPHRR